MLFLLLAGNAFARMDSVAGNQWQDRQYSTTGPARPEQPGAKIDIAPPDGTPKARSGFSAKQNKRDRVRSFSLAPVLDKYVTGAVMIFAW